MFRRGDTVSFFLWPNTLRGEGAPSTSGNRLRIRPTLESLEDRITPTTFGTPSFGTLTHQQQTGVSNSTSGVVVLPSFNTAQGETDSMGPLSFHYDDPGTITTFQNFGFTFPGSLAFAVGGYGLQFI
jgi:hypothetical protein